MDSICAGDNKSIHTMTSNDALINKLHKEELCSCLKNTKLNVTESSNIFQQIKSKYEIADRFDIIRNLSIDFGEIKNIDLTKILELLKIFGKCIEWDAFDSIVEIIESVFSITKQNSNQNIAVLKYVHDFDYYKDDSYYKIFNKIAYDNDAEAMSFAINKKLIDTYGKGILSYSCRNSNFNLIHFLIEHGIDYTKYLDATSYLLNIKILQHITKIPHFDVNAKYQDYNTVLISASDKGCHEIVKFLLTVPGIDVNAKNNHNETALIKASQKGYHEIVKLLLTVLGIDVNAKDNCFNSTALINASAGGYHEVVELLLTVPGIDVNAKDKYNDTALISASAGGHHEVVKLLLTVPGIDVNAKSKYNETALILASKRGRHEIIKLLLTVPGIDRNAKDIWNYQVIYSI